jgi:ferrous iron transport protein B
MTVLSPVSQRQRGAVRRVALAGNPNSGKTTLFNALTGLRQKVANYPGVTVDKKEGGLRLAGREIVVLDLPGAYSLAARSPDEAVARDVLLGRRVDTPSPDLVLVVVDASNLERNLYLALQIADLGIPTVIVLNMMDVAERHGLRVDPAALSRELGLPVVPAVASRGRGLPEIHRLLREGVAPSPAPRRDPLPPDAEEAIEELARALGSGVRETLEASERGNGAPQHQPGSSHDDFFHKPDPFGLAAARVRAAALLVLEEAPAELEMARRVEAARRRFKALGMNPTDALVEARYAWIGSVCRRVVTTGDAGPTLTERVDRILTHRFWGLLIFLALMALVFQSIMSWATAPMDLIDAAVTGLKGLVQAHMPAGDLRDLVTDGVLAGVGGVLIFLPQIAILFLFIGLLEDSGYMARAAFMMDRVMRGVGLHGRSFIPLLSSFACAIPGIMATRTIENRKDRLVTILVAPLMSCSARLPVYALMIAAFIPARRVWGIFTLPALTLLALYVLGFLAAMGMAWLFKRTLLKAETPTFMMELPPYRSPSLKGVGLFVWSQARMFMRRAGTVILAISIVLWALTTYPKRPNAEPGEQLRYSFAGQVGRALEPLIRPLGFDWKIGIGLIGATAAREVFVSTLATVYSVGADDEEAAAQSLRDQIRKDVDPRTGHPVWTPLVGVSLLVYFVLALQCMSTIAVVRRETNGWRWPLFQLAYLTGLAYMASLIVYQTGRALGWGV